MGEREEDEGRREQSQQSKSPKAMVGLEKRISKG